MIWQIIPVFLLVFSVLASDSFAADPLRYGVPLSLRAQNAVQSYVTGTLHPPLQQITIAAADLNNDGVNEYIAREQSCAGLQACRFVILADTDKGIVMLGDISARALSLDAGYSHGIRNLAAIENSENDFAYDRYVWEPEQARYTLAVQESRIP